MSRRIIRRLGTLTLILLTVYVTFLLGIFVAMHQSVERFGSTGRSDSSRRTWSAPSSASWEARLRNNLRVIAGAVSAGRAVTAARPS